MIISLNDVGIDVEAKVYEPEINREASEWLLKNYDMLINFIRAHGVRGDKVMDLLHDVYISLYEKEGNGEGFNEFYKASEDEEDMFEGEITVAQFVCSRIRLYAKNTKYREDIVESERVLIKKQEVVKVEELDKLGNPIIRDNGKVVMSRHIVNTREEQVINVIAASANSGSDDERELDDFQYAYSNAASEDWSEDIVELYALRDNINYCIDVCKLNGFNILNIFKNIDSLANLLGTQNKKASSETVFSKLTQLVEYHDELASALKSVLEFSSKHRNQFDAIVATCSY